MVQTACVFLGRDGRKLQAKKDRCCVQSSRNPIKPFMPEMGGVWEHVDPPTFSPMLDWGTPSILPDAKINMAPLTKCRSLKTARRRARHMNYWISSNLGAVTK